MQNLLQLSVAQNASDLHLCSGCRPFMRVNGQLQIISQQTLDADWLQNELYQMLTSGQRTAFTQNQQLDFIYFHPTFGRLRLNLSYQQQGIAVALRFLAPCVPSLTSIQAPDILRQLLLKNSGLIIVCGATGSGKSTTLAAMVDYLNQTKAKHILMLEDPPEYQFTQQQSLIQQRQIGMHVSSYQQAVYAALRQDPDVILLGEIRSNPEIAAALLAAQTGHLLLTTLHAASAIGAVERLINSFSGEQRSLIREQLASCLLAVIYQRLQLTDARQRQAQFEVLINTSAVSHLIRQGKYQQIYSMMQSGAQYGMQLLPQTVASTYEANLSS